jgi:hypothetical protein
MLQHSVFTSTHESEGKDNGAEREESGGGRADTADVPGIGDTELI